MIENYLKTFDIIIYKIQSYGNKREDNVVLAGSEILKLHGLNFTRPCNDLDVVLFDPTDNQIKFLIDTEFSQEKPTIDIPYGKQKSYKFKKDGLTLNVLLAKNIKTPNNLLLYKWDKSYFQINSIQNIIDAKNSYHLNRSNEKGENTGLTHYVRDKDVRDFQDLKNNNFNLI